MAGVKTKPKERGHECMLEEGDFRRQRKREAQ